MKNFFSKYQTATAWISLVMFIFVISTGVVENCVCAGDTPQSSSQCESGMSCCCGSGENNWQAPAASPELTFITGIQSGCSCGAEASPFNSLDDFLNSNAFDITERESSNTQTLIDTVHFSTMILSRHENHTQELSIPISSISSIRTTVLLT
jgi:hypothetical protein